MIRIGLIREGKIPFDNRVAMIPSQCKWLQKNFPDIRILVQSSPHRCFADKEYQMAGIEVRDDLSEADILFGIKEVPVEALISGKTYLFFSHTKKKQTNNQTMFRAILEKKITLIDYECLEHEDGQRMLGFGFFAGVVGAHNGMMAYGKRTAKFNLERVYIQHSFRQLIHTYFGLKLPNIKVAITGSGRVAHGLLEVMNLMGLIEVDPDEYLSRSFEYPVFVQLKGSDLYANKRTHTYNRIDFHNRPQDYTCLFKPFASVTDILMNGIYWERTMPRLFEWEDLAEEEFRIQTIADITDDKDGSIPCNLGDHPMEDPIYGVDRNSRQKTAPYLSRSVDVMAVGNLPNELPRDASRYFGEQLIKHVLEALVQGNSKTIDRATIIRQGILSEHYAYLREYAGQ
jgi:saccharopine dehydrogenase (NAD+, L-lysine forming)